MSPSRRWARLYGRVIVLALVLLSVSCAHTKAPPPVTSVAPAKVFEAETIDVTVDWQGGAPSTPSADVKLTASDGSGLRLTTYDARAVLYGPLVFTELHLTFSNPTANRREGTFSISLPSQAAVSRFAMKLVDAWQEGEVVPRQTARKAFESVMHRNVDPALLEQDGTSRFHGRVFPILPHESKEIVIAYTELLETKTTPYRLALAGLPHVDALDVQVLVPSKKKAFVLHRSDLTPDHDFSYSLPQGDAVRGGRFAIARVSSRARDERPRPPSAASDVVVLLDSSASRASTHATDVEKSAAVLSRLGRTARSVEVAFFDQEVAPTSVDTLRSDAARRGAAGASNLEAAFDWVAQRTSTRRRVVLVTDGSATAGARDVGALRAKAELLAKSGVQRFDAIALGGARADLGALSQLVAAGLTEVGSVIDGDSSAEQIARALEAPGAPFMGRVSFPQASRVYPTALTTRGVSRANAIAFLELPDRAPLLAAMNGGPPQPLSSDDDVEVAPEPLVERAFVQAQISELLAARADPKTAKSERVKLGDEIVALSVKHRVLTELTAMLVLETEADYKTFGLRHDAATEIPIVGPRGVEIVPRLPRAGAVNGTRWSDPTIGDGDRDSDGIPDSADKCPDEPETYNGVQDEDGCPDRGLVLIEKSDIIILQQIHFKSSSAAIEPESMPIIEELAKVMAGHPEIDQVGVVGHTDDIGDPTVNRRLSEARANAVRAALLRRGVLPSRLVTKGYGGSRPIVAPTSAANRSKNRRVEFWILSIRGVPTDRGFGLRADAPVVVQNAQSARGKPVPAGDPLAGTSDVIAKLIASGKKDEALATSEAWLKKDPDDMLAWIAAGQALEARGDFARAARAYGSLLEVATRPEHRRAAAGFLEGLAAHHPPALALALEIYERALAERPDHPSSHRLRAWALVRAGQSKEAFDTLERALRTQSFDSSRFPGAYDLLRADLGLIAALIASRRIDMAASLLAASQVGATFPKTPISRVVLTWENDETDLDLLLYDDANKLSVAPHDVRSGYGPEYIDLTRQRNTPQSVRVAAEQVRGGPTGWVFGKVSVVKYSPAFGIDVEDRPFVIMTPGAAAPLGTVAF